MVGSVPVGGDAPVSVQSMTTTVTADVDATLQQIAELTAAGCQIVRVAVPTQDDADALPALARKSQIPVVADIHFQPRYVFAAIEAGCAAVRVNPGNIKKFDDKVGEIARAASDVGVSIRIGVNAGSLDPRLLAKHGRATPAAKVGIGILESLGLRRRRLEIVSCPSCGRAQVDVYGLAERVTAALDGFPHPLRVAVMGCVVNGPGEAREADLGVASGNGKGQIFVRGEVVRTVPESRIVETLVEEALRLAEDAS
ncbi:flavodoxin-dependent (E)-4-hydroxy-3-methylbut-2-enyl-diphosphate synthase [Nonomuraea sp. NPDC052265]|uniref:flavodoxin-dependent (E)-4-hydroxy-3-methylbut-2-enyl-diphosphate synthase n=1 Tax=Nonomuraea sp. NPDC052265 TaxID=3364374 RepID=UPI0037C6F021